MKSRVTGPNEAFVIDDERGRLRFFTQFVKNIAVVMHPGRCHAQNVQGPNWTENADYADEA
jgi:hypothetical protein